MGTARVIDLPVAQDVSPAARELQKLWFSLAAQRWSSLLIVPAPGVQGALALAGELAQIGRRAGLDSRVSLLDATRVTLEQAASLAAQLAARIGQGERVLVAIDRIDENPAALALAARCDAALLCVALGRSDLASARDTLERCGRARFLGSVVMVPK
jgi:hypothetical protein